MEYHWSIGNLTRQADNGLVYDVEYSYETYTSGQSAGIYGQILVTGSSTEPGFIPFEDLTQDIVLSWITGSFDIPVIQTELSSSLNKLLTTQSIAETPW